jgi:hypothetical protein
MRIAPEYTFDPSHGYTRESLLQIAAPPEPPSLADFLPEDLLRGDDHSIAYRKSLGE